MLAKLKARLGGEGTGGSPAAAPPAGRSSANDASFDEASSGTGSPTTGEADAHGVPAGTAIETMPAAKKAIGKKAVGGAAAWDAASADMTAGELIPGSEIDVPPQPNPISRTVEEIVRLLHEIEDSREELMARGVQNQTLNVLVEFGFHDRTEGREILLEAALSAASEAHGVTAIDREELEHRLAELLALEHDVSHCRRIARQQGIDLQVLNFMTRLIHKNPGDGGERAVNTFFGYALACGIPLEGIADVAQRVGGQPKSVLPDLDRAAYARESWVATDVVRDAALGLVIGVGMLWLLI